MIYPNSYGKRIKSSVECTSITDMEKDNTFLHAEISNLLKNYLLRCSIGFSFLNCFIILRQLIHLYNKKNMSAVHNLFVNESTN